MKRGREIFEPQQRYRRQQWWNRVGYFSSVLFGFLGLLIFFQIFAVTVVAGIEGIKARIAAGWYILGGLLILYAIVFSIWKVFWLQAIFSQLKKRRRDKEKYDVVIGYPIKGGGR